MRWVLIDQLLECDPGRRATAVKTFPMSDLLFVGDAHGHPIVPNVLLIEAVAQAAAKSLRVLRPDQITMLVAVKSATFKQPVRPGDRCHIEVDITTREEYASERGTIDVEGTRVAEMEMLVVFAKRPVIDPTERDVIIEAWQRRQTAATAATA